MDDVSAFLDGGDEVTCSCSQSREVSPDVRRIADERPPDAHSEGSGGEEAVDGVDRHSPDRDDAGIRERIADGTDEAGTESGSQEQPGACGSRSTCRRRYSTRSSILEGSSPCTTRSPARDGSACAPAGTSTETSASCRIDSPCRTASTSSRCRMTG